jgi:Raf kinase inhibitor-like YbhB/YbcL family protein
MSFLSAVGQITSSLRAGREMLISNQAPFVSVAPQIQVASSAFLEGGPIPVRYTISGEDISPPLTWGNLPSGTREVVLVLEDYDVPMPRPMVHAIVHGLGPEIEGLAEGALPSRNAAGLDPAPRLGKNGMGQERYDGPAALPGHGVHHYVFQVFALSRALEFESAPGKKELVEAMKDFVLGVGRLTGTFERE